MASQQLVSLAISGASLGNNTLLAAQTGYKIRVHSLTVVAAGEVAFRLENGAAGTALTGVITLIKGTPLVIPFEREGICETSAATLLNMELGAAVQVSGRLTYSLVAG